MAFLRGIYGKIEGVFFCFLADEVDFEGCVLWEGISGAEDADLYIADVGCAAADAESGLGGGAEDESVAGQCEIEGVDLYGGGDLLVGDLGKGGEARRALVDYAGWRGDGEDGILSGDGELVLGLGCGGALADGVGASDGGAVCGGGA